MVEKSVMKVVAMRLMPGADLKSVLISHCLESGIEAACIVSCVGSLKRVVLRFANQSDLTVLDDKFEIVSLEGTVSKEGAHLHISISDSGGRVLGGHLAEGSFIYTTGELVLGVLEDILFKREMDPMTGFKELQIFKK